MHTVDFYFDFISPYSWFALELAEAFATEHDVRFRPQPVPLGVLLDASGLIGPAEAESKRRYTFADILRIARSMNLRLEGPPAHPFRSLRALRLVTSELQQPHALALTIALARACWADGRDLTDIAVLKEIAEQVGVDGTNLKARITAPEVKAALRKIADGALQAGVFGVPTFIYRGELFWGHDRMPHLANMLQSGRDPIDAAELVRLLDRPRGAERKKSPMRE